MSLILISIQIFWQVHRNFYFHLFTFIPSNLMGTDIFPHKISNASEINVISN